MRVKIGNRIEERDLPQRDHFQGEMDHLSECVMQNKDVLTPGEEGLRDLKIVMAIYDAARSGKTIRSDCVLCEIYVLFQWILRELYALCLSYRVVNLKDCFQTWIARNESTRTMAPTSSVSERAKLWQLQLLGADLLIRWHKKGVKFA